MWLICAWLWILQKHLKAWDCVMIGTNTYTLACGFFLEKSQARPRSEMRTWPCSSSRILAGYGAERDRVNERERWRDTDDVEVAELWRERYDIDGTMKETSPIRNSIYNFIFSREFLKKKKERKKNKCNNPACFQIIRGNLLSWLSSQKL